MWSPVMFMVEDLARAGDALRLLGGADEARAVELSVSRGIGQHVEDVLCRCVDGARDHDLVVVLCHLLMVHPTGRYGNPMPEPLRALSPRARPSRAVRESSRCGCPWARPKPRPTGDAHRERIDERLPGSQLVKDLRESRVGD